MDQTLIPFVVAAPPVPVQPHLAPVQPSQAELEVCSSQCLGNANLVSQRSAATSLGRKDI